MLIRILSIDQIIKSWCFILSSIEFTILFLFHCQHFRFFFKLLLFSELFFCTQRSLLLMPGSRISRKTIRLFVLLFIFLLFLRDNFVFNFSMFCLFVWCALSCSYLGHFFRRRRYWLRLMLHPPSTRQLSRDSGYFDILRGCPYIT